jgi:hypothetical protein
LALISTYRNNAALGIQGSGFWGSFDYEEAKQNKDYLVTKDVFSLHSIVNITFTLVSFSIEVIQYSGNTTDISKSKLIKVYEVKNASIDEIDMLFSIKNPNI